MISSIQYQILKTLENGGKIDTDEHFEELLSLRQRGFVTFREGEGLCLCGDWRIEVEEYENSIRNQKLQEESLKLSMNANRKARNANIISIIAIVTSSILSILALVFSLLF